MTENNPDRDEHIAEAIAEFNDLRAGETDVDVDEFIKLHPDLEPDLKDQLQALLKIEKILSGEGEADKGIKLPSELSGYQVLCTIGSGGMGCVLLAVDRRLDRKLAIKLLSPGYWSNPVVRTRFMEEARALASINHPHIVGIYNLGRETEPPHFVMEHVEGIPLMDATAGLPLRQKIELFLKIVKAVAFLHESRIVHRDLKPGNILIQANHEPKIVDFGLALRFDDRHRDLTLDGELLGTPAYFSPEQASTSSAIDIRSDVFPLGTILYELATGELPFSGRNLGEQVDAIRTKAPVPPSRLNRAVSRDLQNICMQALEKNPDDRYPSAGEFARDIERYLAGESVIASPKSYSRLMSGRIAGHLKELEQWKHDRILSEYEHDSFRKLYDRLVDREDAWIMEMRRFSLMQVLLYLGAWILVIGAFLFTLYEYERIPGPAPILFDAAATFGAGFLGMRLWRSSDRKRAVPVLLSFCLLLPSTLILLMQHAELFAQFTKGDKDLEFFHYFESLRLITNAQLWWAILFSIPLYVWIRRKTHSPVFSLVLSTSTAIWCLVTLLRLGVIEWFETDPGKPYLYLIPFAAAFLLTGLILERFKLSEDSRYFYPVAVLFTLIALSGVAGFHEPYRNWLEHRFPFTRGQIEYLFAINGLLYWILQRTCEQAASAQMRRVAKAYRFFIPGHILGAIFILGINATDQWNKSIADSSLHFEARLFEILLPLASAAFVFAAIPKQMKNFLASGMLFLAVGIIRLQQNLLEDWISWPLSLMIAGIILILGAGSLHLFGIRPLKRNAQKTELH
jgi:serine/threonine protein kinase